MVWSDIPRPGPGHHFVSERAQQVPHSSLVFLSAPAYALVVKALVVL